MIFDLELSVAGRTKASRINRKRKQYISVTPPLTYATKSAPTTPWRTVIYID